MPFYDQDGEGVQSAGLATWGVEPEKKQKPETGELFEAAFMRENSLGSLAARVSSGPNVPPDPRFDPWQDIKGYEDYAASFMRANSLEDVAAIKGRIDKERQRAELLYSGGAMGTVAELVAGIADPINLIPVGGQTVMVGKMGARALSGALRVGAAGLASGIVQEAALQATQDTRTMEESAVNVAAQTFLSGLLGGAVGMVAGRDISALAKGAMEDGESIARDIESNIPNSGGTLSAGLTPPGFGTGSVGAAQLGRTLEQESIARLGGIEEKLAFSAPTLRTQVSPVVATRSLAQDLAEQPLITKGNLEGLPSPTATESVIRQWQYPLAKGLSEIDNIFVKYRMGADRMPVGNLVRIAATDLFQRSEKLGRDEFLEAVGRAMRRSDAHEIPEVAEAAKYLRKTIFDPLKDLAIERGLLPEDVDPGTASSYLMRQYNYGKIAAERNKFTDILTDWYAAEQTKKADIKRRVTDLTTDLQDLEGRAAKAEAQIEGRESTLAKTEVRQSEVKRLREFAYKRSAKMSEPLDVLNERIKGLQEQIGPHLSQLDELRNSISAEKEKFPEIKEADALIWKLIGAGKKVRESQEIVDTVDALKEFSDALQGVRGGFSEGVRSATGAAKQARIDLGATHLVALEKLRADIGKEIKPFRKELNKARKEYKEIRKRRIGRAQGGAVFESKIIERGNSLSDQAIGKDAAIEALREKATNWRARADARRIELENALMEWQGKSTRGVGSALERRAKLEAARSEESKASGRRLKSADKDIMAAARRVLAADTAMDADGLRDIARQTVDRILGTPAGRLPYDVKSPSPGFMRADDTPDLKAGALKQRVLMIPDELIEEYLESDVSQLAKSYVHTMAPDVIMAERGWLDFDEKIKPILEQYEVLRAKTNDPKELARLNDRMKDDIRDIKAIWERLRGTYRLPEDPNNLITRGFRIMRDLNYMRMLGGMTISALPDTGAVVMQHGMLRLFRDGIAPAVRNWKTYRLAAEEVKMAGEALDMVLDSRAMSLADVMDDFGRHSKFERGVSALTGKFGVVSLMAPWNASLKQLVGIISQTRSLQAIDALINGTIDAAERTRLAQFGIGENEARAIGKQFAEHGEKHGSLWWANTSEWTDRNAVEVYRAAMSKEVNKVIVTPGQEKPLWMSTEAGKTIGQFKSFAFSSMQRVTLAGLQKRDANTIQGAALMTGLGMLAYFLKTDHDRLSDDPGVWVKEGIDRSGLTGWLFELNNMIEKATWGEVGLSRLTGQPMSSRYASRNWLGSLLGPSADLVGGVQQITGAAASGEWNETSTRAMRRMLPFQNLVGFKLAVDRAEEAINNAFGIPMKNK